MKYNMDIISITPICKSHSQVENTQQYVSQLLNQIHLDGIVGWTKIGLSLALPPAFHHLIPQNLIFHSLLLQNSSLPFY